MFYFKCHGKLVSVLVYIIKTYIYLVIFIYNLEIFWKLEGLLLEYSDGETRELIEAL